MPIQAGGDRVAALSLSSKVYSRKAVLAASYKLSGHCVVLVDADGDRWIAYVVAERTGEIEAMVARFIRELVDQALRQELELEFGDLRTLIVAQAFSEGNLLDPETDSLNEPQSPRISE